jgi:hypothetical protein
MSVPHFVHFAILYINQESQYQSFCTTGGDPKPGNSAEVDTPRIRSMNFYKKYYQDQRLNQDESNLRAQ